MSRTNGAEEYTADGVRAIFGDGSLGTEWPGPITPNDCRTLREKHDAIAAAQQAVADAHVEFQAEALRIRRKYALAANSEIDTRTGRVKAP